MSETAPPIKPAPGPRRKWFWAWLALTGLAGAIWLAVWPLDAKCLGKPVSYWVKRLEGVNPEQSRRDWQRLAQAGPEAVPVYEALLWAPPSRTAIAYQRFWVKNRNRWPDFVMRRLPRPRQFRQGGDFRREALSAISQVRPPATNAIPVLLRLLGESPDLFTISVFGYLGPAARDAIPQLLAYAVTPDPNLQQALCFALDRIGVFDEPVIAAFERFATNGHPIAVQHAARVLGRIGSDPEFQPRVAPRLLNLSRSRYAGMRATALFAMGDLAVATNPVMEALQSGCDGAEVDDVRRNAQIALERLDRAQKITRPWLEKLARHDDLEVRLIATRALCERAGQTNAYVQALGERITKGDETGSWKAIEKLASLAKASEAVAPLIVSALGHPEPRIRGKAAITLGQLGAAAKSARPALAEALQDQYKNVRDAAKDALDLIPE